jgi:hypothetical protein
VTFQRLRQSRGSRQALRAVGSENRLRTIGIVRSFFGFDLFGLISNPPADDSGKAGLRY